MQDISVLFAKHSVLQLPCSLKKKPHLFCQQLKIKVPGFGFHFIKSQILNAVQWLFWTYIFLHCTGCYIITLSLQWGFWSLWQLDLQTYLLYSWISSQLREGATCQAQEISSLILVSEYQEILYSFFICMLLKLVSCRTARSAKRMASKVYVLSCHSLLLTSYQHFTQAVQPHCSFICLLGKISLRNSTSSWKFLCGYSWWEGFMKFLRE